MQKNYLNNNQRLFISMKLPIDIARLEKTSSKFVQNFKQNCENISNQFKMQHFS